MTIDDWLVAATTDADRRDLPALKPLLGMLADATRALRTASWNHDAAGPPPVLEKPPPPVRSEAKPR
jgi:hypothetical protein